MAVSIKDIAEKANVTPTAVSMALRGLAGVSPKKREEIRNLAQKMGYSPSFLGRALQGGRTHSLGILWSICGLHPSMNVTRDLTLRAMRRDHISYVVDSLSDPGIIEHTLQDFARRRVDALIIAHDEPEKIMDRLKPFPAVVVVGRAPRQVGVDFIYHDHTSAICRAARHFLSKGRRRLMTLNCDPSNAFKAQAFLSELREQGVAVDPEMVLEAPSPDLPCIQETLDKWHAGGSPMPDAVFAVTDYAAAAAMKWFRRRGVRIPETVAIAGFNDDPFCECFDPPLASVRHQNEALADEVERLIFSRLETPDLPYRNVEVSMSFIWRESAG